MKNCRVMASIHLNCNLILLIFLSLFTSLCSCTVISDSVFGSSVLGERRLLQALKHCPVDFETMNYTALTSKCKAPDYDPKPCCSGFKEIACQHLDAINDLTTDCASIMFSYINIAGNYPPGLFASECKEGKEGLECPADPPVSQTEGDTQTTPSPPAPPKTPSHNHSNRLVCGGPLMAVMSLATAMAFLLRVM